MIMNTERKEGKVNELAMSECCYSLVSIYNIRKKKEEKREGLSFYRSNNAIDDDHHPAIEQNLNH